MLQGKPEPQKLRKWWKMSTQINRWSIPRTKQVFVVILLTFTPFSVSNSPDITLCGWLVSIHQVTFDFFFFLHFIPLWVRCRGVTGCGWQDDKIQLITVIIGWEATEQLVLWLGRRGRGGLPSVSLWETWEGLGGGGADLLWVSETRSSWIVLRWPCAADGTLKPN